MRQITAPMREENGMGQYVFGKIPPQALPLEEAVLGALMLDRDALGFVSDLLTPEVFYTKAHQLIFQAILQLHERQNPVDILTVTEELRKCGELEQIGGSHYLVELTNRVASAANIEYHSRIILQKHIQRQIIAVGARMMKDGFEETSDCFDTLQDAEQGLFAITQNTLSRSSTRAGSIAFSTLKQIEQNALKARAGSGITGLSCGMAEVDALTGGWQDSDLIILAARPGMGKTGFALSAAINAAQSGIPLAFFSLEMANTQLVARMLAMLSETGGHKMRQGQLSDADLMRLAQAAEQIENLPIYLDDTPAISIPELRAKCRRLKRQHGIRLVIVDYLQLMRLTPSGLENKNANREQEVAGISRALKSLAKELNVPVIALSQLSRAVESRGGAKRPQLSDLRDSGAVEQDADIVSFIYRPEYYGILEDESGDSLRGIAEIIFAKNRHGETDTVKVRFEAPFTRFSTLENTPHFFAQGVANAGCNAAPVPNNPASFGGDTAFPKQPPLNANIKPTSRNDEDIPF
ncbi:MAG: replicative DNA helicase [Lewinellaceae bacterium]|nr:replicative DNA helicase [Lewinellaceae bacterium]